MTSNAQRTTYQLEHLVEHTKGPATWNAIAGARSGNPHAGSTVAALLEVGAQLAVQAYRREGIQAYRLQATVTPDGDDPGRTTTIWWAGRAADPDATTE